MSSLISSLKQSFPGREPIVVSRGITALYLAMVLIRQKHGPGEVILPATVCPSVAVAIMCAGLTPRFCDVDLDSFRMSAETVETVLSAETRAILVVYMFGKIPHISAIVRLAESAGIEIVEDLALSAGGTYKGSSIGRFGNYSVLSFNDAKILPGSAGVLLLKRIDERHIAQQYYGALELQRSRESLQELSISFRNLTHGWYDLMRYGSLSAVNNWLTQFHHHYRELFLYRRELTDEEETTCVRSLRELPEIIRRRREYYLKYEQLLDENIRYVRFASNEVCWRLPLLLATHSEQLQLMEMVRRAGCLVSNHYFPISFLCGDDRTKAAKQIGLRAVNFWVDGTTNEDNIKMICRLTNDFHHGR